MTKSPLLYRDVSSKQRPHKQINIFPSCSNAPQGKTFSLKHNGGPLFFFFSHFPINFFTISSRLPIKSCWKINMRPSLRHAVLWLCQRIKLRIRGGFRGSFNIVNDAAALTIIPLPRCASLNCLYGEFAARAVGLFRQTILSRVFFFCRAPRATR